MEEGEEQDNKRPRRTTARAPRTPQPLTEFQLLVADSVGKTLPIFGTRLFEDSPSTFAPVDHAPVPAEYVVGPGDELTIHVWGQVNLSLRATVNRNGQVFVPKVGDITVAGVHFSKLDEHFRTQIGRLYRNFDVAVNLGRLRTINVFFVGQVRRPGTYTISSLSTLVNALFEAGGPNAQGSLRHIQVKRGENVVTDFDFYDFILKGDKSRDAALMPGDVIYVPPVGPLVAVSGSVNSPAIYELKGGNSSLSELLSLAGGLNSIADGTKVSVERIDDRRALRVVETPLTEAASTNLKDGDIVRVLSIVPRFENAVTLRGNVANPGRYPWFPGMRVRDLIPNKEMLLTRSYWTSQNALVDGSYTRYKGRQTGSRSLTKSGQTSNRRSEPESEDRPEFQDRQDLMDSESSPQLTAPRSVPIPQPRADDLEDLSRVNQDKLREEVKLIAPQINWDYASIQRNDPVDLSTKIIPFSIGKALLDRDEENNVELQAGDVVTIFSQRDISVPQDRQTKFIRIEGEVKSPGIYRLGSRDTLKTVLERAGGLTGNANLFGSQLTRETARQEQQKSLDQLVEIMEAEIHQRAASEAKSHPEETASAAARMDSQRSLIENLRRTKATGRVVLQMDPDSDSVDDYPPLVLEDGDRLFIPAKTETVSVVGAVYTQSSFLFQQGANVDRYVKLAGNGTRTSDRKHILVVRADGSVVGKGTGVLTGQIGSLKVLPGDTIVIPSKIEGSGFGRALRDWTQVASQLAITAASLSIVSR